MNGFMRAFDQSGRSSRDGLQGWKNQPLACDVVDKEQHPDAERIDRGLGLEKMRGGRRELFDFFLIDGLDEHFARRKMPVQRARADARLAGNIVHGNCRPMLHKSLLSRSQDAHAILLRVGALLSRSSGRR